MDGLVAHRRDARAQSAARAPRSPLAAVVIWSWAAIALIASWFAVLAVQRSLLEKRLSAALRSLEAAQPLDPDAHSLQQALVLAQKAQEQGTAVLFELAGRVYWLAANAARVPRDQVRLLREADRVTRQAIARRPTWPYSWVLLTRIQFALEPRGAGGPQALDQALRLGVRGFSLQQQLLEVRLVSEDRLSPELAAALHASLVLGLRDHGYKLAEEARLLGRTDWICDEPLARAKVAAWCDQQRPARLPAR